MLHHNFNIKLTQSFEEYVKVKINQKLEILNVTSKL